MCLATVYKTVKDTEEVVLKNVSKIYVEGGSVRLVDIMGAEVVLEGSISFVDLANSVVKLNCPAA
ncbi:MAG TPA: CooT family nickel-binding protein [Candidatus Merdisoma faecalis]|uniref:CooT family nickel-binding protein n=1 Tax=Lachnoclostridium sp. An138 TaxID=1965560 RepID=UPI000B39A763|nr:CooT family nickel-binding protein [Lachnoclostridium sp. An138]OUQ18775.1 RNA-binding protein [Lachnoclostridium sp. An138]HIR97581.1 CooT family nickel-binding protein [Candidatus Merdisoma faecalis]